MLLTYDITNTKLPHHKKIINKLNQLFDSLHPKLKESNPIISGSYAINLLFKPTSPYKDIDIYFETESDFIKAADCFSNIDATKVTANKNCIIYDIDNFQYQLIIRNFTHPESLIRDHDFYNSAIAIQNDKIFLLKKLIYLYDNDLLDFQNLPFYDYETPEDQISGFSTFFNRILKYTKRYDFDLSEQAYKECKKIQAWLNEKQNNPLYTSIIVKSNIYYNLSYSETNSYHIAFEKLLMNFYQFIHQYEATTIENISNEVTML